MKRAVCFFLVLCILFSYSVVATDSSAGDGIEVIQASMGNQQESDRYVGYYVSGCGYSSGVSRVSYYVEFTTITISGPTGTLMVVPVSGMGYFDFPTQANQVYSASAPGYETSSWVAW